MAKDYKIEIVRDECIGCNNCVLTCGKLFELGKDDKSELKGSKNKADLEIGKNDFDCANSAADLCPVKCIHIYELKTKKKLI